MKTIEEAAKEYRHKTNTSECLLDGFKAGVEFAERWIPVEEELPEDEMEIIAKNGFDKEIFAFYEKGYRDDEYLRCSFTHWRPINHK